jgi:hypothetical protein
LPFTAFPTTAAGFAKLPAASFVVPDVRHDMHDGSVREADDWLRAKMDPYVQWAKTHNSLLVLITDEDGHDTPDNHIPMVIVGQPVVPGSYSTRLDHYNLLRTVEAMYELSPLGKAAAAAPITGVWKTSPISHTTRITASADGYVQDGAPKTSFGTASTLDVKTKARSKLNRDAYLKFDTRSFTGGLANAKLRFHAALSAADRITTSVFSVADTNWTEKGLMWDRKPALGSSIGSVTIRSTSYAWYEIDVTDYIKAQQVKGKRIVSFGLHNAAESATKVSVHSREAAMNQPELVLTSA